MTTEEFNKKYADYLYEGGYGLDIDIPEVVNFLDDEFKEFIKLDGFKYQQIKLKFNFARFYFVSNLSPKINHYLAIAIEAQINSIVKRHDNKKLEKNDN